MQIFFLMNEVNILPTILFTLLTYVSALFPFTVHNPPHLFEGREKKRLKISPPFFCLEIIIAFRRDIGEGNSQNLILFHTWSRKALDNSGTNEF